MKGNLSKRYEGSAEYNEEQVSEFAKHINSKVNPHNVTAEQTGAYTKDEVEKLLPIGVEDFFTTVYGYDISDELSSVDYKTKASEGLEFADITDEEGACEVSGIGDCEDSVVVIPPYSPDGKKVLYIGEGAFRENTNIKVLFIPKTVMIIKSYAITDCSNLKVLVISNPDTATTARPIEGINIEKIYYNGSPTAFKDHGLKSMLCGKETKVYYSLTDLTLIADASLGKTEESISLVGITTYEPTYEYEDTDPTVYNPEVSDNVLSETYPTSATFTIAFKGHIDTLEITGETPPIIGGEFAENELKIDGVAQDGTVSDDGTTKTKTYNISNVDVQTGITLTMQYKTFTFNTFSGQRMICTDGFMSGEQAHKLIMLEEKAADTDAALSEKADSDSVYTKGEVDTSLGTKADADDVYTKGEVDTRITEAVESALSSIVDGDEVEY